MKKTKKAATKKTASSAKSRLKKTTKVSDQALKRVSGGTRNKGIADDGV